MTLDVVNSKNEKVGSVDLRDEVFGGPVKRDLIWAAVVRQNASERRGTHMSKNRALVSGSGKKPYKQKGTGRPQVGSTRTPLWRHGGTVFGPTPRDYDFAIPKKVERGALLAAFQEKLRAGAVTIVDELRLDAKKTREVVGLLKRLGVAGKPLVIDVRPDDNFSASARNIAGLRMMPSGRCTARDIAGSSCVLATRAAVERLQEVLG